MQKSYQAPGYAPEMIFNVAGFPEDEVNVTQKDIEFASEFTDIDLYLTHIYEDIHGQIMKLILWLELVLY